MYIFRLTTVLEHLYDHNTDNWRRRQIHFVTRCHYAGATGDSGDILVSNGHSLCVQMDANDHCVNTAAVTQYLH